MLAILALSVAPERRLSETATTGDPDCPCLTTTQRSLVTGWSDARFRFQGDAQIIKVTLAGIDYSYPTDYGTDACARHDAAQQPYCSKAEPPEWCADLWCYVDASTCKYPVLSSSYFPGADLKYSYATCGSKNSFASWFGDNAASDGSHTITDIADLLTSYLTSIVSTLELNHQEVSTADATCEADSSCPCATCTDNAAWMQSIDVQARSRLVAGPNLRLHLPPLPPPRAPLLTSTHCSHCKPATMALAHHVRAPTRMDRRSPLGSVTASTLTLPPPARTSAWRRSSPTPSRASPPRRRTCRGSAMSTTARRRVSARACATCMWMRMCMW